ncbi:Potassium voltage-gated channel protein Shab [Diplonema papillatum]|nr:Potassium voltage-gated channel protein Shab [Diplonema papillatum]
MAVAAMAMAARVVNENYEPSLSSESQGTITTIDLHRGKSIRSQHRRRSEVDISRSSEADEPDDLIYAVPVKSSHVVTDWKCEHCECMLLLEIQVRKKPDNQSDSTNENDNSGKQAQDPANPGQGNAQSKDAAHADSQQLAPSTWRERLWCVVEITDCEVPPYPVLSRLVAGIGLLFIVLSVVNFIIETQPEYYLEQPPHLFRIEAVCIAYFTAELVLRLVSAPSTKKLLLDAYTVVDILSVVPFYVGLGLGNASAKGFFAVRILRLMRVFKVFRISRYNEAVNIVLGSLNSSSEGLYLLLFLILLSTVLFSSAIYYVEREFMHFDDDGEYWYSERVDYWGNVTRERSPFQSIMHVSWFCLVTLTTVGYGDDVPTSVGGKAVAVVTMLCGTLVIAFPMVIIGQNFQEMYRSYRRKKSKKKTKYLSRQPKLVDKYGNDGRSRSGFDNAFSASHKSLNRTFHDATFHDRSRLGDTLESSFRRMQDSYKPMQPPVPPALLQDSLTRGSSTPKALDTPPCGPTRVVCRTSSSNQEDASPNTPRRLISMPKKRVSGITRQSTDPVMPESMDSPPTTPTRKQKSTSYQKRVGNPGAINPKLAQCSLQLDTIEAKLANLRRPSKDDGLPNDCL